MEKVAASPTKPKKRRTSQKVQHPGKQLEKELMSRNVMKKDFAKKLGIMPNHLSEILGGKRNISPTIAIKIEKALGVNAEVWIDLQGRYSLFQARKSA